MNETLNFDYQFKYILVGDSSVGKSSLLSTFIKKPFTNELNPTMGVEFATRKIEVKGKIIKLQIWDTAGQEAFRTITRAYYKNAVGVLLLYDLTNPKSIESLAGWISEVEENSNENIKIIVIGNKSDIYKGEKIQLPQEVEGFEKYTTSARTGENVGKVFQELTSSILRKIDKGTSQLMQISGIKRGNPTGKLTLNDNDHESNSCC